MDRLRFLGLFCAFTMAVTAPIAARAQKVNDSIASAATEFLGIAPRLCIIRGAATVVSANNASLSASSQSSAAIQVTSLVAQNGTGVPNAADMQVSIPVICTVTHTVTIQSSSKGMTRDGAAIANAPGFRTLLDYQVRTAWAGKNDDSNASALPAVINTPDAAQGNLLVTVLIPQGGQPLVAGSYSDTLTILLTPSL